jgi:Right handed beta helix region
VTDNRVRDGGISVAVFAFGNASPLAQVERNVVSGGVIGFGRGSRGVATDNVVTGAGCCNAAISAYKAGPVTISDNVANYNLTGISAELSSVEIRDNTADHNSGDGIWIRHLDEGSVVGNHTWFNGNLGINALPDTLGGDNWAKHNGNPFQCVPTTLCSTTGKPKG